MQFELPYPPSANTYYRNVRGRTLLSKKGRQYKTLVAYAVIQQLGQLPPLSGPVAIHLALNPPDARRRDLDNCLKPVLDALTGAGIWLDDSQVKSLYAEMLAKEAGGKCIVEVLPYEK